VHVIHFQFSKVILLSFIFPKWMVSKRYCMDVMSKVGGHPMVIMTLMEIYFLTGLSIWGDIIDLWPWIDDGRSIHQVVEKYCIGIECWERYFIHIHVITYLVTCIVVKLISSIYGSMGLTRSIMDNCWSWST